MTKIIATAAVALMAAGCGGDSPVMTPSAPSAVSAPAAPGGGTSASSTTGTWTGTGSDSSSQALGAGGMMGLAGMGAATWQLTQTGATVTGTVTFEGMHGRTGTFTGVMSGEHMTFTLGMPGTGQMGSMGSNCASQVTGTAYFDPSRMTLTCTYAGTNSCLGPFGNGQMVMARR